MDGRELRAEGGQTCLAQARQDRPGKWALEDLTDIVLCKDLTGLMRAINLHESRAD